MENHASKTNSVPDKDMEKSVMSLAIADMQLQDITRT